MSDLTLGETAAADALPDSRARHPRASKYTNGLWWQVIFCANCGADGGMVPEEQMQGVFYLCNSCWETHGKVAGTMALTDDIFRARMKEDLLQREVEAAARTGKTNLIAGV